MHELWQGIQSTLGVGQDAKSLDLIQICLRTVVVYLAGLLILRVFENRLLGKQTAFDIVLGFILGSVLSRAINGTAPFFLTLVATALLVALHRLLGWIAFHSHRFGELIKGRATVLVRDGEVIEEGMRRHSVSHRDLEEGLRQNAHLKDPARVKEARFERSGEISILKEPRVLEVRVEEGVQTVRIEIG
jgi:uncharacterized membrane protein YcaP (DUF421 family)